MHCHTLGKALFPAFLQTSRKSNHLCHCLELLSTPCVLGMWGCHFPAPHVEGSHSTIVQGAVQETFPEGLGIERAVVS